MDRELILRRLAGSVFQSVGAATLKDLSPNDLSILPSANEIIIPAFERITGNVCVSEHL